MSRGAVLVAMSLFAGIGCSSPDLPTAPSSNIALAGTRWAGQIDDSRFNGRGLLTVAFEKGIIGVTGTWAITFADPTRNRTGVINEVCTFYCASGPDYEFFLTGQNGQPGKTRCEMHFPVHVDQGRDAAARRMTGHISVGADNCLEVFRPEAYRTIDFGLVRQ